MLSSSVLNLLSEHLSKVHLFIQRDATAAAIAQQLCTPLSVRLSVSVAGNLTAGQLTLAAAAAARNATRSTLLVSEAALCWV